MGLILWCTEQQGADRIETLASRTLYNDRWNRPALILHTYPRAASTKTIAIKPRFTARIHVPKLAWETDTSTDQGPSVVTNEVLKYALHIVWNTSLQFLEMSILIYSCVNNTPRHKCLPAWQMGLVCTGAWEQLKGSVQIHDDSSCPVLAYETTERRSITCKKISEIRAQIKRFY